MKTNFIFILLYKYNMGNITSIYKDKQEEQLQTKRSPSQVLDYIATH